MSGQLFTSSLGFYLALFVGSTLLAVVAGMLSSWIDRKVTALVQARVGPPLLQPLYDFVKLMGKEAVVPEGANRLGFALMPLAALAAVALAATILIGNVLWQNFPRLDAFGGSRYRMIGDVIVVLYLLIVPSMALVIGASSSNNPFASVGASREMKLMSYELPLLLAVAAALTLSAAAERRFSGELQRQVDEICAADECCSDGPAQVDSPEVGSAGVPLRLDRVLALRGAGPKEPGELLRERARTLLAAARSRGAAGGVCRDLAGGLDGQRLYAAARGGRAVRWAALLVLALCVTAVFFCAQAKLGLVPFDCAEAETEIAGGVFIEYGGPLLGLWKLARMMLLFVLPLFIGVVFMGGFRLHVPGGTAGQSLAQAGVSLLKYVGILVCFVLVRNTNPRVRIDQAMRFFLGPMTALALLALGLAVAVFHGLVG